MIGLNEADFSSLSDSSMHGHYVCANKINNLWFLNDDSSNIKIVDDSFVSKNVVLVAISSKWNTP